MTGRPLAERIASLRAEAAKLRADGFDNQNLAYNAFTQANEAYWAAIKVSDSLLLKALQLEAGS